MYAAQPHVIHHTTVVQPNSIPSAIYPAPVPAPRSNGVAMGMVAGTTMAMSAGKKLKIDNIVDAKKLFCMLQSTVWNVRRWPT